MRNSSLSKTEEDTIESLSPAEIKLTLAQIDKSTYVGFRDKVMILTVDLKAGTITLERHETKTKRARTVPLSSKIAKLIAEYMDETEDFGEDMLFLTYGGRPITANSWR